MALSLLFYNSIDNLFNLLCSAGQYNLALLDLDSKTALFCLNHNKESGKCNEFVINQCNTNVFSNALRPFTWNLPN
jgi:hypothetical protein